MNRVVAFVLSVGGLIVLFALAFLWAIPHMENDLTERAMSGLDARGIDGNEVQFDGRNGQVSGPGAEAAKIAIEDLRGARSLEAVTTTVAEPAVRAAATTTSTTPTTTTTTTAPATSAPTAAEPAPVPAVPTTTISEPVSVDVTRVGRSVVLSGTVGIEADRQRLVNEAVATGYPIEDLLVIDEAVDQSGRIPKAAAGLVMALFVGADDATLRLRGDTVEIAGTAKDPVEAATIQEAMEASRRRGLVIEDAISVVDLSEAEQVVALQSEIDQIFELSRIIGQEAPSFGYSSDELNGSAISILDRVIVAMRRYPKPVSEIEGHTDSDGSSGFNQELSVARAQTVLDYLTDGGIDADRLFASGKGETEPIADNATEIGRLENRRVNFIVGKRAS